MQNKRKTATGIILILSIFLLMPIVVQAGNLEPSAPPAGTMHTLEELYNQMAVLQSKIDACKGNPAPVPTTGQTTSYAVGDDGSLQKGVASPTPRFTDNSNGTVKDNLTGLVWLKNANPCGPKIWADALAYCNSLANGQAGLTDGSVAGNWRLPNINELHSLTYYERYNPALPVGHPFTNVQSSSYWSGTSYSNCAQYACDHAWYVYMYQGGIGSMHKSDVGYYVWPVRDGN